CDFVRAYAEVAATIPQALSGDQRLGLMVSPMLSCEEAFLLAKLAREFDPEATFAVGPIPVQGQDKTFPGGYTIYAEKCPNARGVRRVLEAVSGHPALSYE